ncbi:uracil-DNA glycosylase [Aliikangiella maris]|uniref:Uracil-DNA glycosylase n=2 Tax=Aliikangiella maris TaxID=3162458 RepID=A0ABV3MKR6_9GAMM
MVEQVKDIQHNSAKTHKTEFDSEQNGLDHEKQSKDIDDNNLSWAKLIEQEKQKAYYQKLSDWVSSQRQSGKTIFPPADKVMAALKRTPYSKIKVVILGQDPYHGPNQANGLSFSVNKGIKLPPSLQNIFKELNQSIGIPMPSHGDLSTWADQGVLLLNTVLTVEQSKPQSHQKQGWEILTDEIIQYLNHAPQSIIFLLWGSPARKKVRLIDTHKHHVLEAPHPSPLSAHRGFFGCGHFKKVNELLQQANQQTIDWALPE